MLSRENKPSSVDTCSVKPLIKWAGGKRQIAAELFSRFPSDWNLGTYIEPFIGGGAMFLHAAPTRAVIADLNSRLFGFYLQVIPTEGEILDEYSYDDFLLKRRKAIVKRINKLLS